MRNTLAGWLYGLIVAGLLFFMGYAAHGRDLGQWSNNDPEISQWYKSLMRPDLGFSQSPCCGEADAYWCDDISVNDGHVFCAITDDRDDAPRQRPHRNLGEKFEIPPDKMKFNPNDHQKNLGNPTGHAIIFLSTGGFVYCFVPSGGV